MPSTKIEIANVNIPGRVYWVDAEKYKVTRKALLNLLPNQSPGLTQKEIQAKIPDYLPDSLFPSGQKSGWWAKTVQLDLEAKKLHLAQTR
ncbi:MAG: hypothetical protein AAFQ40_15965 [Cyanobacteria bacterium J06623_5]